MIEFRFRPNFRNWRQSLAVSLQMTPLTHIIYMYYMYIYMYHYMYLH
jgi:hypothetical protein